jgi:hypothetical protein
MCTAWLEKKSFRRITASAVPYNSISLRWYRNRHTYDTSFRYGCAPFMPAIARESRAAISVRRTKFFTDRSTCRNNGRLTPRVVSRKKWKKETTCSSNVHRPSFPNGTFAIARSNYPNSQAFAVTYRIIYFPLLENRVTVIAMYALSLNLYGRHSLHQFGETNTDNLATWSIGRVGIYEWKPYSFTVSGTLTVNVSVLLLSLASPDESSLVM